MPNRSSHLRDPNIASASTLCRNGMALALARRAATAPFVFRVADCESGYAACVHVSQLRYVAPIYYRSSMVLECSRRAVAGSHPPIEPIASLRQREGQSSRHRASHRIASQPRIDHTCSQQLRRTLQRHIRTAPLHSLTHSVHGSGGDGEIRFVGDFSATHPHTSYECMERHIIFILIYFTHVCFKI